MAAETTDGITETSDGAPATGADGSDASAGAAAKPRTLANDYPNSVMLEKPKHDHSKVEVRRTHPVLQQLICVIMCCL